MTSETLPPVQELVPGFEPESDLERAVVAEPELRNGAAWGGWRDHGSAGSTARLNES